MDPWIVRRREEQPSCPSIGSGYEVVDATKVHTTVDGITFNDVATYEARGLKYSGGSTPDVASTAVNITSNVYGLSVGSSALIVESGISSPQPGALYFELAGGTVESMDACDVRGQLAVAISFNSPGDSTIMLRDGVSFNVGGSLMETHDFTVIISA